MKRFFINRPLFIFLGPLVSGVIIYLLILLYHNEVRNVIELYADSELQLCIVIAFLVQETTRRTFLFFYRDNAARAHNQDMVFYLVVSLTISLGVIVLLVNLFYRKIVGFSPSFEDLILFISLYGVMSLFISSLLFSYNYLNQQNKTAINKQKEIRQEITQDFHQFRDGINPNLLFESLEALLVLIENNNPQSEDLLDNMAQVYRYILARRSVELIDINSEIEVTKSLINIFDYLPSAKIRLDVKGKIDSLIIPGTLLKVAETITRKSITSKSSNAFINLSMKDTLIVVEFKTMEKLNSQITIDDFNDIKKSYQFYTDTPIKLDRRTPYTVITLPELKTN